MATTLHRGYIYSYKYDYHHHELCKLESRQLFDAEVSHKLLFSNVEVDPSISAFIKHRVEIITSSARYAGLLASIEQLDISIDGFKVEYLALDGDDTEKSEKSKKLRDIGFRIYGYPDFSTPSITYSLSYYKNVWYFGILLKPKAGWHKHKKKPFSFSNSIGMNIAKTLVSIASKGNKGLTLLDACCGVGTIMLEACFSDFNIEGCDINVGACEHTQKNLAHYGYTANVYCSDINGLNKNYDALIVDLPYNLYSYSNDAITLNIIASAAKLAARVIIVSIAAIESAIKETGLKVVDCCTVEKRGKSTFSRNIWVCERVD